MTIPYGQTMNAIVNSFRLCTLTHMEQYVKKAQDQAGLACQPFDCTMGKEEGLVSRNN